MVIIQEEQMNLKNYQHIETEFLNKQQQSNIKAILPQGLRLKIPGNQKSSIWDPYTLNPKTLFRDSPVACRHWLKLLHV